MYRDDPLDDEMELRELLSDVDVDALKATDAEFGTDALGTALDVLRILQGWVDDEAAATWFRSPQRRLGDRTPLDALADADTEETLSAAQAWAAAQG
jgi:uncharacterized protein (DUF2384 family)